MKLDLVGWNSPQVLGGLASGGSRGLGRILGRRMHTGVEVAPCKGGTVAAQPAHCQPIITGGNLKLS